MLQFVYKWSRLLSLRWRGALLKDAASPVSLFCFDPAGSSNQASYILLQTGVRQADHLDTILLTEYIPSTIMNGVHIKKMCVQRRYNHESKTEYSVASCLFGLEHSRLSYSSHWIGNISAVSILCKYPAVTFGFYDVSAVYFWEADQKTHSQNSSLWGRTAVLFKILWQTILCSYGSDDDWRYWSAGKWPGAGAIYRSFLYRTGGVTSSGWIIVWP